MKFQIIYSKEAAKFLKKNAHFISEDETDKLVISGQ